MTPQEITIAVAELDGWNHWFNGWNKSYENIEPLILTEQLPPYLTSRDAIVPVIEKQDEATRWRFIHYLLKIPTGGYINYKDVELALLAPVSHLCEALLRATGKWKD